MDNTVFFYLNFNWNVTDVDCSHYNNKKALN